ncbi:MAG: NADPH:quinone oxidoreductase family protein [Ramlibacter sp.]
MQAVLCHAFGDPSAIRLGEIEAPVPQRGELLVDVHAAAVTFMDTLMTAGKYQMRPPLPYVPGSDAAGVVAAVGEGVTRFKPGDRVACGSWHGSYGERMVCSEFGATALPPEVDFATGSAVRHGYGTAHYALVECARLQPGETVFVTGAAGGVGLAAVDVARHLGARVIAGIGSPAKAAAVRERGAHEVIDYRAQDLKERIKSLTGGRGVDVFFDNVGGEIFTAMTRLMNWGGRMLPIGFTGGEIPSVPMNLPLLKNYSIVGAFWGAWTQRCPEQSAEAETVLMQLVAAGNLRPLVGARMPLRDFAAAIALVTQRQVQGRVVLEVR